MRSLPRYIAPTVEWFGECGERVNRIAAGSTALCALLVNSHRKENRDLGIIHQALHNEIFVWILLPKTTRKLASAKIRETKSKET